MHFITVQESLRPSSYEPGYCSLAIRPYITKAFHETCSFKSLGKNFMAKMTCILWLVCISTMQTWIHYTIYERSGINNFEVKDHYDFLFLLLFVWGRALDLIAPTQMAVGQSFTTQSINILCKWMDDRFLLSIRLDRLERDQSNQASHFGGYWCFKSLSDKA